MDNNYYFNDLKINIKIENNDKQIKYFKELLDVNQTCKYEVPVLNWDGYKKYDDKIAKLNKIIITFNFALNSNYIEVLYFTTWNGTTNITSPFNDLLV